MREMICRVGTPDQHLFGRLCGRCAAAQGDLSNPGLRTCECIGIRHYSPPCKGGVDARSRKCREATLVRADGVARSASPIGRSLKKRSAKSLGLKSFAELTTPSAVLWRLRAFLLMPQPPLLFKEGNVSALKQSVNSFTRSQPWATILRRFAAIQNYDSI